MQRHKVPQGVRIFATVMIAVTLGLAIGWVFIAWSSVGPFSLLVPAAVAILLGLPLGLIWEWW